MNERMQQIEAVELSVEQAKDKIKKFEMLKRLDKNTDFQDLIKNFFLKDYAIRLVELKAVPQMQAEREKQYLEDQLKTISFFNLFLMNVEQEGRHAEAALEDHKIALEELYEEESEE